MAKSPNAFRTISEAADEVGTPQHVLRFWETKFSFITPVKRAGGRRFYRPQDVAVLKAVKKLLHDDGLTIRGVQRLHKDGGLKRLLGGEGVTIETVETVSADASPASAAASSSVIRLQRLLAEIEGARTRLDAVLTR
ncbi:MerR family transcriptional regulator [Brevundimonas sp.]|uniref:MerR family transcriptional regulator n=1 Tax=Brevundimonas sp. TaxID=1871086 RepID=UPI002FDA2289